MGGLLAARVLPGARGAPMTLEDGGPGLRPAHGAAHKGEQLAAGTVVTVVPRAW